MSDVPASLYASLIGQPMVAVNNLGTVYAEGTVESVHVKPIGGSDRCFYAKLSDGKFAPIGDLIHGRPVGACAPGIQIQTNEPHLLLKLKAWFAKEIGSYPPRELYEYGLKGLGFELGCESLADCVRMWKHLKPFEGHEFQVGHLYGAEPRTFRIGFYSARRADFIKFELVKPEGKETAA